MQTLNMKNTFVQLFGLINKFQYEQKPAIMPFKNNRNNDMHFFKGIFGRR